jgi:hypothetical protein
MEVSDKLKAVPLHTMKALEGEEVQLLLILDLSIRWGEWSASHAGHALALGKRPLVPTVQETGWAPEPVWIQRLEEKSFASARDRTSITWSSTHSQTLHWLSYLASNKLLGVNSIQKTLHALKQTTVKRYKSVKTMKNFIWISGTNIFLKNMQLENKVVLYPWRIYNQLNRWCKLVFITPLSHMRMSINSQQY